MTVLDAYAVIAYLRSEPAAERVAELLDGGNAAMTAVGLAEVVDHLVRVAGVDEEDVMLTWPSSVCSRAFPSTPRSESQRAAFVPGAITARAAR